MSYELIINSPYCHDWMFSITRKFLSPYATTISLVKSNSIVAAISFDSYNGSTLMHHLVIAKGHRVNRDFIKAIYAYAFIDAKVNALIGIINPNNKKIRSITKKLGYKEQCLIDENTLIITLNKSDLSKTAGLLL